MGRQTKTLIPTASTLLTPKNNRSKFCPEELTFLKAQQKFYFDRHATPLRNLSVRQSVLMQMKDGNWTPAKVTGVSQSPLIISKQQKEVNIVETGDI